MPSHPGKKKNSKNASSKKVMEEEMNKRRPVSKKKAKKILRDGKVRGKKLTPKQRRFFGAIAGGN